MYQFEMQCSNLFFGGRFIAQGVVIWAAATNLLKFIARLGTYASFGIPETHTYGNLSSKNTPFIQLCITKYVVTKSVSVVQTENIYVSDKENRPPWSLRNVSKAAINTIRH